MLYMCRVVWGCLIWAGFNTGTALSGLAARGHAPGARRSFYVSLKTDCHFILLFVVLLHKLFFASIWLLIHTHAYSWVHAAHAPVTDVKSSFNPKHTQNQYLTISFHVERCNMWTWFVVRHVLRRLIVSRGNRHTQGTKQTRPQTGGHVH